MRVLVSAFAAVAAFALAPQVFAAAHASSFFTASDKPSGTYAASNLIDADPKTVWIEGKDASGVGEWFAIDLPRGEVKKVVLLPGHGADQRMFKKYAHLKEVKLEWLTMDDSRNLKPVKEQTFTFEDNFKPQEIPVEGVKLGEELFGGQLKVTIVSVYPGIDFQDTAISEVTVVYDEFPAQLAVGAVSSTLKGSDAENLIDGAPKTAWISDAPGPGQSVTINAPDYGLSAVVITPGNLKDLKKSKEYARPKEISIEVGKQVIKHTLKDSADPQRIDLPAVGGYTGSSSGPIKITIDSVYPGSLSQNAAIGEIQLLATNYSL